ncbi:hypothetical protein ACLOJK_004538, partial [Asimina triloba]
VHDFRCTVGALVWCSITLTKAGSHGCRRGAPVGRPVVMAAEPITASDNSICPTSPLPPISADNGDHEQTPVRHRATVPPSISDPDPSACNPDLSKQAPQTIKQQSRGGADENIDPEQREQVDPSGRKTESASIQTESNQQSKEKIGHTISSLGRWQRAPCRPLDFDASSDLVQKNQAAIQRTYLPISP